MQLPLPLQAAIEEELNRTGRSKISDAREELTASYRDPKGKTKDPHMSTEAHRLAYIASRMPATYAAVCKVMQEIRQRLPEIAIHQLLDLGAGPGTAMWGTIGSFPEMQEITLLEKDSQLAAIGKRLAAWSDHPSFSQAHWTTADLEKLPTLSSHDMVILSYSIGEIADVTQLSLIEAAWNCTSKILVIIEPGTPLGFARIRAIRSHLIGLGAHMIAPCPHMQACPLKENDWCHFSVRVERSAYHRQIKSGTLGYEDEKFSYLVFSKEANNLSPARVLRHPIKRSGHMHFTLCTPKGIEERTVSKRLGEIYKECRRLEWGDAYPDENQAVP
jgi:ribosomal protein RSM22 (predicted rRNA methylase)